jgi:serine/threonine protein kinase/Flp pilus assembly protein TadD
MMIDYSGQQIGSYRLVQRLGFGGFASVYLGQHVRIASKQAAIKLLHMFDVDSKKFQQEAETTAALDHPHIIRLIDFDFHDQMPFLVMDYAPGGSLRSRHPEGTQVPLATVVQYVQEIAKALEYAHSKNVIHRDIKPDNILIGAQGELRLSDFGIAVLSRTGRTTLAASYDTGGTAYYMAPEQSRGKPEKASDQYALGIMVYEWLCGKPPFSEGHAINIQYQHAFEPVPSLREQLPTLLPAVEQVIMHALAKDPKERFATVQEFATALADASTAPQVSSLSETSLPEPPSQNGEVSASPPYSPIVVQHVKKETFGGSGLFCPTCGVENRPGAKFCNLDGQPLAQGVAVAPPRSRSIPIRAKPVFRGQPIQPWSAANSVPMQDPLRAGLQHLMNKNYVKAIEQFAQAQQQGGSSYDVLFNLGCAHREYAEAVRDSDKKQFNEYMKRAAEYFEEALRQKNDAVDTYFQLGLCYRDLCCPSHAITAFRKALALDPQDPAVYYQLGQAAMEQNAYREAEAYLQDGLKIKTDHPLILIALGRLYTDTKQPFYAIKWLRQATQQDPDVWEGWYELGRAHMKQKEWKFALSALERARQIAGYKLEVYTAMAMCFLKINQKADARLIVNEILQRDPHDAEAIRLKRLL